MKLWRMLVALALALALGVLGADTAETNATADAKAANVTEVLIALLLGQDGEAKIVDALADRLSAALVNQISNKLVDQLLNRLQEVEKPAGKSGAAASSPTEASASKSNATDGDDENDAKEIDPSCPSDLGQVIRMSESVQACMVRLVSCHRRARDAPA